jgi:hypothetical protein
VKKGLRNAAWRRVRELADWARVGSDRLAGVAPIAAFDGVPRVALLTVSFNTRELTKLMLLSLAEQTWSRDLNRVVIVDNRSSDGSPAFLESLARSARVSFAINSGPTSHGVGLRRAVAELEVLEAELPEAEQSNVLLVVDTDIVFLRADTLELCSHALRRDAALVGELQFDLGEPYAHPCCFFVRRDAYHDARVWPFVDHGAPALWLQRSLRCAGLRVMDFPLRSDGHIVHRGRGSIAGVNRLKLHHAYGNVRDTAHFHGNPQGAELWQAVEARHVERLGPENDAAAIDYIAASLDK